MATPAGLAPLEAKDGVILANRKLVVMRQYDVDDLWRWLERTVASCGAATWEDCVDTLRAHFHWEFEVMRWPAPGQSQPCLFLAARVA